MYKGKIKGFPEEVVEKMLEHQAREGYPRDVTVFEKNKFASTFERGFRWGKTNEGEEFWFNVIKNKDFDLFFERYPKDNYPKKTYPKVMMVSTYPITDDNKGIKRVVFMEKNGKYLAWMDATTLEQAKKETGTTAWRYAKDIESSNIIELTFEDISKGKGVGIDPKLIRIKEQQ